MLAGSCAPPAAADGRAPGPPYRTLDEKHRSFPRSLATAPVAFAPMRSTGPLVVHVLPRDMARGAQVFARALRDRLDGACGDHRTLALFSGPPGALRPDHQLEVRPAWLRRAGFDPRVAYQLRRALAALAPHVVVAHGGEPLKYCVPARPPGSRLVYYKIGSSHTAAQRGLRARWHARLLQSVDRVVAISDDLAVETETVFGLDPGKVAVIPNGRDPALYSEADHSGAGGPVQLVYVGHLEPAKRPLWFVEVVRRALDVEPATRAVMVGDGPMFEEVREAARELPIRVLGRRDDVPAVLAGSHVLVSPSASEGMPGVLVEAGLSGLPVVATDVAGAGTVVEPGVTGHIVPRDDLRQLAGRTAELVADPRTRRLMGEAARRRCHERFTLDRVARSWALLLRERHTTRA